MIRKFKEEKVNAIVANGDIGEDARTLSFFIEWAAYSEIPTIIQPGSHEKIAEFESMLEYFSSKNPTIINARQIGGIKAKDHSLVFLSGSDWNVQGGEYHLAKEDKYESGIYKTQEGIISLTNMNDLEKMVKEPENTIVVCHVPRKFDNTDTCVDVAYFGEKPDGSVVPGLAIAEMIRQKYKAITPEDIERIADKMGFKFKIENRGNEHLKEMYKKLGITKAVSGHFHESGHQANDSKGNKIPQGTFTPELFWNSGYGDAGQCGILNVDRNKVSYENLKLKNIIQP